MSADSWQEALLLRLNTLQSRRAVPRLAIVGIGHKLHGDDAAGVIVARRLSRRAPRQAGLLILDGGALPENLTGALRQYAPDLVLLIDATLMGAPPGTIRLLEREAITAQRGTAKGLLLDLLVTYLGRELGCAIVLLGIQPAQFMFAAALSPAVNEAVDEVIKGILAALPTSAASSPSID